MPDDVKEMLGIPVSDDNRKRSKSEPRSQHKMRSKVRLICLLLSNVFATCSLSSHSLK